MYVSFEFDTPKIWKCPMPPSVGATYRLLDLRTAPLTTQLLPK